MNLQEWDWKTPAERDLYLQAAARAKRDRARAEVRRELHLMAATVLGALIIGCAICAVGLLLIDGGWIWK